MNLKMGISVMVGLLGVVLAIVGLQGVASGSWTEVGQSVAPVIVMIALIGFVIVAVVKR